MGWDGRERRYLIFECSKYYSKLVPSGFPRFSSAVERRKDSRKLLNPPNIVQELRVVGLYDDLEESEVKLGFILNDDFFCFLMTRKVSTTCSRNARAGS